MGLSTTTIICLVIIAGAFVYCYYKTWKCKVNNLLSDNKKEIESYPAVCSTLGVLGTFYGITVGLMGFDTAHLDQSIPVLLDGLKTAFFTSLLGMVCSMYLQRYVNKLYDHLEIEHPNTAEEAIKKISESVEKRLAEVNKSQNLLIQNFTAILNQVNINLVEISTVTKDGFYKVGTSFDSYAQDNKEVLNNIESYIGDDIKPFLTSINTHLDNDKSEQLIIEIKDDIETKITTEIKAVGNAVNSIDSDIKHVDDRMGELLTISEASSNILQESLDETKRYSEVLRGEVDEIETKMGETNTLLTNKFNEFSELLKKSNTEALVDVMKKVTEEFQKQMNALISKLIQENFEKLNDSVEKLNKWQQENKEMITELTNQYRDMSKNFSDDSVALNKVKDDTQVLVGEGGKLSLLIAQLNKVMIDDTKFIQITKQLEDSANLTKDNMVKFDDATSKLNEWVRKQRNFVDAVNILLQKLEELSKLKNYSEEFWKETKQGMTDGVGIIKDGTIALNKQINNIDQEFYSRLSSTLANLDACIQAMVNQKEKI